MHRSLGIALLVTLGAVGGGLVGARARALAQDGTSEAPTHEPSRYEYRVFCMDYTEYSTKDEWKELLDREGGNALKTDGDFRAYVLDFLAKDGWELVQVVQEKEKLGYFYLRRLRIPGAPYQPGAEGGPEDPKELAPDPQRRKRSPH